MLWLSIKSMNVPRQVYALRPLIAADHDAIAEVWHSSASLPCVGPPVMPSLAELRNRVDLELAAGWHVTVAVRDNAIIGFVAIKPSEAILDQLFIRPGSTGGGVGQALLAHAMRMMPDGFALFTRSGNARARHFYERAGLIFLRDGLHPQTGDPVTHYRWPPR